jgi:hypothetical protein
VESADFLALLRFIDKNLPSIDCLRSVRLAPKKLKIRQKKNLKSQKFIFRKITKKGRNRRVFRYKVLKFVIKMGSDHIVNS